MRFRYRHEEEMKDSGVEWIGKIPKNWNVKRNKNLFKINKHIVGEKSTEYKVLSLTLKGVIERDLSDNAGKIPATFDGYQIIDKDSLLLCLFDMDVTPRISGYVPKKGIVSPAYTNIDRIGDEINNKFYSYWFLKMDFEKILLSYSKSLRNTLTNDNFMSLDVIEPQFNEQIKIGTFIEIKTAQFDTIISKKESLIKTLEEAKKSLISEVVTGKVKVVKTFDGYELVERKKEEMKDSGVEWLGDVPREWDVTKLKYVAGIIGGYAFSSDSFKDEGVQIIKIANLYNNKLSLDRQPNYVQESFLETHKEFIAKKDDILISLTGTLGKRDYGYSILLKDNRRFLINQRVGKINFNSNMLIQYGIYVLQSESYLLQLYSLPTGTKQANLSNEQVLSICIALPSKEEQERIYDYLDFQIDKIQLLINKTEIQIQALKEAKQSLISEAVTGKIEILD